MPVTWETQIECTARILDYICENPPNLVNPGSILQCLSLVPVPADRPALET